MKIYKKKKEIKEVERLEKIVCDWCGKEFKTLRQFHNDRDSYSQNRCEIDIAFGEDYPELDGDCRCHFITDELCFSCQLKLLSVLNRMGINFYKDYRGQNYWTKKEIINFIGDKKLNERR